ncbi:MAG: hypothetical protein RIC06_24410 [Cyclobacteriaceae bacterium]
MKDLKLINPNIEDLLDFFQLDIKKDPIYWTIDEDLGIQDTEQLSELQLNDFCQLSLSQYEYFVKRIITYHNQIDIENRIIDDIIFLIKFFKSRKIDLGKSRINKSSKLDEQSITRVKEMDDYLKLLSRFSSFVNRPFGKMVIKIDNSRFEFTNRDIIFDICQKMILSEHFPDIKLDFIRLGEFKKSKDFIDFMNDPAYISNIHTSDLADTLLTYIRFQLQYSIQQTDKYSFPNNNELKLIGFILNEIGILELPIKKSLEGDEKEIQKMSVFYKKRCKTIFSKIKDQFDD